MRATEDRDNEYLRPAALRDQLRARAGPRARSRAASTSRVPGERPFVYFPLHVTDDYKIKRVIPHCVDQAAI